MAATTQIRSSFTFDQRANLEGDKRAIKSELNAMPRRTRKA
jgi:hypothetical protein